MTQPRWQETFGNGAIAVVFGAAFPKLAYRLRWPTRLGPRGLVAYIAFNTVLDFALRTWVAPYFKRMAEQQERAKKELWQQLGRDPTEDELLAHLGITRKR